MSDLVKSKDCQKIQKHRKFSNQPPQNSSEAEFMEPGKFYACTQVIFKSFYHHYGKEIDQMVMAVGPLAAGVAQTRAAPCGTLIGACMMLGLEQGSKNMDNLDDKYGLYKYIQNTLFKDFKDKFGHVSCEGLLNSCCTAQELDQKLHHERVCRHTIRFVHDWLEDKLGIQPVEQDDEVPGTVELNKNP
jgi:C_GCAxxG_C_C family probable redox protein